MLFWNRFTNHGVSKETIRFLLYGLQTKKLGFQCMFLFLVFCCTQRVALVEGFGNEHNWPRHVISKIVQIDIEQFSIEMRLFFRVLGVEQHPTQVFQINDVAILSHGSNSGGPKLLRASRLASISLENSVLNFSQLSASRSIHMSSVSRTLRRNMWVGPVEKEATQSLLR